MMRWLRKSPVQTFLAVPLAVRAYASGLRIGPLIQVSKSLSCIAR